jgi:hypothetical protein
MKNIIGAILVLIFFVLSSFLSGCGSAEAVEIYTFSTSISNLRKAVDKVLNNNSNPNVIWDTASYLLIRRFRDGDKDKSWYTSAIDTIRPSKYRGQYFWITIKEKDIDYNYSFAGFQSNSNDTLTSNSGIMLMSLWNNKGLDLRQGENVRDFSSHDGKLAKNLFEKEFIDNIDKELKLKHSTGRSFWD